MAFSYTADELMINDDNTDTITKYNDNSNNEKEYLYFCNFVKFCAKLQKNFQL